MGYYVSLDAEFVLKPEFLDFMVGFTAEYDPEDPDGGGGPDFDTPGDYRAVWMPEKPGSPPGSWLPDWVRDPVRGVLLDAYATGVGFLLRSAAVDPATRTVTVTAGLQGYKIGLARDQRSAQAFVERVVAPLAERVLSCSVLYDNIWTEELERLDMSRFVV